MKLFIVQLPPFSCYFIPFWSNVLLRIVFSNTLNLCSSLNARNQISHPYKTTGRIMILYILTFTFVNSRQEDRRI
jgi:hypothetical protein